MRDINIGKIDILDSFSFFEVESKYEDDILNGFSDCKYKGMNVTVELSKEKKSSENRGQKKKNYSKRKPDRRKRKR